MISWLGAQYSGTWERAASSDGVLLLKRDLLDQQIIDVHGRKVVRVNDVELDSTPDKFRGSLAADIALWTPVVKALGLKLD